MLHFPKALPIVLLLGISLACVSCRSGRRSAAGFRLPPGNIDSGKAAFVALECHSCHEVSGVDLPRPAAREARIVLGGAFTREISDGAMVTWIINPSEQTVRHSRRLLAEGHKSPMPDYGDKLTVRQLTDLVAFLQSRYEYHLPAPRYPGYY